MTFLQEQIFVMWTSTVKVNIVYKLKPVAKLVLVFIYKKRNNFMRRFSIEGVNNVLHWLLMFFKFSCIWIFFSIWKTFFKTDIFLKTNYFIIYCDFATLLGVKTKCEKFMKNAGKLKRMNECRPFFN